MNEFTLTRLKILVERAVRPVRASTSRKRKMREELLAHVTNVFEEEVSPLANEQAALERTAQRFGNLADLTGQLQESVPTLDSIERFADWLSFRPCESSLRRAVRYTMLIEMVALLFIVAAWLLLGRMSEWSAQAIWDIGSILLSVGYMVFTICILESSMRRSMGDRTGRSWLKPALVLAGSGIVSILGFNLLGSAFGVSLTDSFSVAFVTVGLTVWMAGGSWSLAHVFAARKRYVDEYASLQLE